jgi:hypothetical protein
MKKNISEINTEEMALFLEEIRAIFTEKGWRARQEVIEGYHAVGNRVLQELERTQTTNKRGFCNTIAKFLNKSERTIYQAVQFAEKYSNLEDLPEGKAISWFAITQKYLPDPREVVECEHLWEEECKIRCKKCKKLKAENKEAV